MRGSANARVYTWRVTIMILSLLSFTARTGAGTSTSQAGCWIWSSQTTTLLGGQVGLDPPPTSAT